MTDPNAELTAHAERLRGLAEAEASSGWYKVDFNDGDDPAYRPLWGVANDAYFNPPADEETPWLAVEVHTGTEATAALIAALGPDFARKTADQWDGIARRHEQRITTCYMCRRVWTPDGCPDLADALAVARTLGGVVA